MILGPLRMNGSEPNVLTRKVVNSARVTSHLQATTKPVHDKRRQRFAVNILGDN